MKKYFEIEAETIQLNMADNDVDVVDGPDLEAPDPVAAAIAAGAAAAAAASAGGGKGCSRSSTAESSAEFFPVIVWTENSSNSRIQTRQLTRRSRNWTEPNQDQRQQKPGYSNICI